MTLGIPLDGTGATDFSIPELVRHASSGSIRVPSFQRSFVWDSADVRKFFDSIYRGFPVGTILLWQQPARAEPIYFGPVKVDAPSQTQALWVVDGQQRVTSLFASLSPLAKGVDDRFEIYFDLTTRKFVNPRRGVVSPRSIPLREALETRSAAAWTRQHADDLEENDFDVADSLVGILRDYRIPAYIVAANSQDLLREVFDRVNSSGRPITRAQTFHALFANETEPGSPASVAKALEPLSFGSIEDGRIVQSLLAIRGGDVARDIHVEFSDGGDPADWYDQTEVALNRAIHFLQSESVEHLLLMPNTLPIPVLAAFFHLHEDPTPWVRRLLARWLWRGWAREFGREGGQTPTMRRAITSVYPKKMRVEDVPSEYEAVKRLLEYVTDAEPPDIRISPLRTDKAWGRLVLLALASLKPLSPDGTAINVAHEFEKRGPGAVSELVPGNRSIAGARGFWPVGIERPSGFEDEKVLRSHAINAEAQSALQSNDVDRFIATREREIEGLLHRFLATRLEVNAPIRPPLEQLIVADLIEG